MRALMEGNPDYAAVTFMKANWDQFSDAPIVSELNIPRRSTLVMFNEGQEVGRVIAQTSKQAIEALFQAAISS